MSTRYLCLCTNQCSFRFPAIYRSGAEGREREREGERGRGREGGRVCVLGSGTCHVGWDPHLIQLVYLSDEEIAIATGHLGISYVDHVLEERKKRVNMKVGVVTCTGTVASVLCCP